MNQKKDTLTFKRNIWQCSRYVEYDRDCNEPHNVQNFKDKDKLIKICHELHEDKCDGTKLDEDCLKICCSLFC